MASAPGRLSATTITIGALILLAVIAAGIYLSRPAPKPAESPASAEAKAYVAHLQLSDVTMKASENFMKQRIVEIEGKITNNGSRPLRSVYIYCIFYGVDGRELHRQRIAIVPPTGSPLQANQTRPFRLPFDTLPEGWNQAVPRMYIAGIDFASS
ncbi:MAG: hypothetical protein JO108_29515 [Acidobacteriaceae bacterium]|nr:hypothetical protein [Acidobacteriaceae bacterium]